MTEEEKMMLRRLIVKEDELEEMQIKVERFQSLAVHDTEFRIRARELLSKITILSREVDELKRNINNSQKR